MITVDITKYDDGDVRNVRVSKGDLLVEIDQQRNGGWLIQSNFCDFYEQRAQLPTAIGIAVSLIAGL